MKRSIGTSILLTLAMFVGNGVGVARAAVPDATASGGTIAFSYGDQFPGGDLFAPGDVFTVRPDGTNLRQLTHAPAGTNAALPSVSNDGTKIVYEVGNEANGNYEIWTMDVDGANQTQITDEPGFLHLTPSWSPDGSHIAFSRCDLPFGFLSSCDIAVIDADGSNLRTVVGGHLIHSRPEFSPDGNRIVFQSDRAGAVSSVWVVNSDGSHLRRVTKANTLGFWPDWSADGRRIEFTDNCCRPHSNIWSVNPDGSGARRLTDSAPGHDSSFGSYAPSGRDIVFVNNDAYGDFCCNDLVVRHGDGSLSTVLTGLEGLVVASWGPTPSGGDDALTAARATKTEAAVEQVASAAPATEGAAGAGETLSGRILFGDFNSGQIFSVKPDGSALTQLTHTDENHAANSAQVTPDGRIVFSLFRVDSPDDEARIWIMNADGSNAHQLAPETAGFRDYVPNVTPDGKRIVFARCQPGDGVCAIWIMRFDGTHMRALTPFRLAPDEAIDFSPALSHDGKQVAFVRFGSRGISIQSYVMNIDGTHEHAVTAPALEGGLPDFAPNGRLTVTSRSVRLGDGVFSLDGDGRNLKELASTRYPFSDYGSVYSPDGKQIAFSSDRNYSDGCCADLFVMDADGTHQHRVPLGGVNGVSQIAWVPSAPGASAGTASAQPATVAGAARVGALRSWCAAQPAYRWAGTCRQSASSFATRRRA